MVFQIVAPKALWSPSGTSPGTLSVISLGLSNFADAIIIGAVSVTLSLAGLEPGDRLGTNVGERGELIGGLVLIAVGIAVANGIL